MTTKAISQDDLPYGDYFAKSQEGGNQANYQSGMKLDEHPYVMSLSQGNHGSFNFKRTNPPYNELYISNFGVTLGVWTPIWSTNDDLALINKLNTKIRGSSFSGSNFIIEGHQTAALITTNARRIAKLFQYLKHGNIYDAYILMGQKRSAQDVRRGPARKLYRSVYAQVARAKRDTAGMTLAEKLDNISVQANQKKIIEDASSLVLEFNFGLQPLWEDLHDSMASLAQRTVFPEKVRFRARRKISGNFSSIHTGLAIDHHGTCSKEIRVVLERPPNFSEQLNFTDLRGALWEFTPWSFLVDYALPVGQWLGALDFAQTWHVLETTTSFLVKGSAKATGIMEGGIGLPAELTPDSRLPWAKSVHLTRTIGSLSFADALQLTPELKPLQKIASVKHMVNAVALMGGRASSFGKSLKF